VMHRGFRRVRGPSDNFLIRVPGNGQAT
jgi:hypothetical protein